MNGLKPNPIQQILFRSLLNCLLLSLEAKIKENDIGFSQMIVDVLAKALIKLLLPPDFAAGIVSFVVLRGC